LQKGSKKKRKKKLADMPQGSQRKNRGKGVHCFRKGKKGKHEPTAEANLAGRLYHATHRR